MSTIPSENQPPAPPRAVAISGILFSVLYIVGLVLIRLAAPADPADPGEWLADPRSRDSVRLALHLVPFVGIAFLWFMGVLRNRIGFLEDRFLATVFLGSGLLFVASLFASAAISWAIVEIYAVDGKLPAQSETYAVARRMCYTIMNPFGIRMAAMFMFVTSSIGFRTSFLPRWLAFVGFALGLVLLLIITNFAWIALIFPMWVLLVSAYIVVAEIRQGLQAAAGAEAKAPHEGTAGGTTS